MVPGSQRVGSPAASVFPYIQVSQVDTVTIMICPRIHTYEDSVARNQWQRDFNTMPVCLRVWCKQVMSLAGKDPLLASYGLKHGQEVYAIATPRKGLPDQLHPRLLQAQLASGVMAVEHLILACL